MIRSLCLCEAQIKWEIRGCIGMGAGKWNARETKTEWLRFLGERICMRPAT